MAISKRISTLDDNDAATVFESLATTFSEPPVLRLACVTDDNTRSYSQEILDVFSNYLSVMGDPKFRSQISSVSFDERNEATLTTGGQNPYFELHSRSRELSNAMRGLLENSAPNIKQKAFQWFFL